MAGAFLFIFLLGSNTSFQQPFNQYGMSPTYKNVTAHIGFRSMNFSRYSLAGHLFLVPGLK
ncbi:MAG: hypothetical protein RIA62_14560 [Cyclobacteriaceae bacterium]